MNEKQKKKNDKSLRGGGRGYDSRKKRLQKLKN